MTTSDPLLPHALELGLRGLRQIDRCQVAGAIEFNESGKCWVITLILEIDSGKEFVPKRSLWKVLVEESYPFGRVAFYPSADGGITATFPHQERNSRGPKARAWRDGKLCLDSPFRDKRYMTISRDPVGEPEGRLLWHVQRALAWLEAAAEGTLLAAGDPFEVPQRPLVQGASALRIVHDESPESFNVWRGRNGYGTARIGAIPGLEFALFVAAFFDQAETCIREWTGRPVAWLAKTEIDAFWWIWPKPVVLRPWHVPGTWGELRRAGGVLSVDVNHVLRSLARSIRGKSGRAMLLIGYPIPERVSGEPAEMNWDAIFLPKIPEGGEFVAGFLPGEQGWWRRVRHSVFATNADIVHLTTENWSAARLQARGRLPESVRKAAVAVIGVGALGSIVAELLVRAGVTRIALIDSDLLSAGNICRHVATLADVGKAKVEVVANRLMQISPHLQVEQHSKGLPASPQALHALLDPYDVILDCTASSDALVMLARPWWSVPKLFLLASLGHAAQRLFVFASFGNQFSVTAFDSQIQPWLSEESATWAEQDEILEGAGCWSPLFPARYDDVLLAAAVCVKVFEGLVEKPPSEPILQIFEQRADDTGFQVFARIDDNHHETETAAA